MKKVNREELIQQLESVEPGLSPRDNVEQSSCYVFKDGHVITFNEEIACRHQCDLGFTGAVPAAALLALLRKLNEDELEISTEGKALVVTGRRKRAEFTLEQEIQLPVDTVEVPGKWRRLADDFLEAIDLVQHCASSDDAHFSLTCVHIAPQFVEACDNVQISRVTVDTGVKVDILVRRDSIKHITSLGMTKVSETETWIHFRNPSGLILSCRRFADEEYHDMEKVLNFRGEPITLPKGLSDAADKASIFSAETSEDPTVTVALKPGKIRVRGAGASGSYREIKKVKYSGPPIEFRIAPRLLMDITKRYNEAEIKEGRLRVDMGKAIYVSFLAKPKD